jgi:hypothetical protein
MFLIYQANGNTKAVYGEFTKLGPNGVTEYGILNPI